MITRLALPAALLLALTPSLAAQNQQQRPPSLADAMRRGFTETNNRLLQAAQTVPEGQLDFKPVANVRSIRQQIAHIIDGNNYYCAHAAGRSVEWSDSTETANLPRAQLVARLQASISACNAVPASAPRLDQWMTNVLHVEHHYGNVVTTMRVAGITPPPNS